MADVRAITAVCEAVIYLLRSNYRPADFDAELEFEVYSVQDFTQPMKAGVSVFLYRIFPNGTYRHPPGRRLNNGRMQTLLPLDLHFLLTAWGTDASLQQTVAGWMMRVLEDHPLLPAGLLNARYRDVFEPEETVEIALGDLRTEDLLRIWETLTQNMYQLSVPYLARNVRIASREVRGAVGAPVQEREYAYHEHEGGEYYD
jgi:hypothetical protein